MAQKVLHLANLAGRLQPVASSLLAQLVGCPLAVRDETADPEIEDAEHVVVAQEGCLVG
jgi:hypothetical protein